MAKWGPTTRIKLLGGELLIRTGGLDEVRKRLDFTRKRMLNLEEPFNAFQGVWYAQTEEVYAAEGLPDAWPALSPAYCVTVGTRILTRDLRWVAVESLEEGDELWAPSEGGAVDSAGREVWRYWEPAVVEANDVVEAPVLRLLFESGRTITATADHPWLVRGRANWARPLEPCDVCGLTFENNNEAGAHSRWKHGSGLRPRVKVDLRIAWRNTGDMRPGDRLPRYLDPWQEDRTYEAGWLAGVLDGEGHLSIKPGRGSVTERGATARIGIAQKEGAVAQLVRETLAAKEFHWSELVNEQGVVHFEVNGGAQSVARILGSLRPVRLVPKWRGGVLRAVDEEVVVGIEDAGVQPIARLQTSARTYFAEGLAAHNSAWKERRFPGQPIGQLTGRLKGSLTGGGEGVWDVSPRTLRYSSNVPYFRFMQLGTSRMPARPPLVLLPDTLDKLVDLVKDYVTAEPR